MEITRYQHSPGFVGYTSRKEKKKHYCRHFHFIFGKHSSSIFILSLSSFPPLLQSFSALVTPPSHRKPPPTAVALFVAQTIPISAATALGLPEKFELYWETRLEWTCEQGIRNICPF